MTKDADGCRLRAKALGHRHAEDILGRALYVGDQVVAMVKFVRCTSEQNARRSHMLVAAEVVTITPKRVRVRAKVQGKWDKVPAVRHWDVQDHELVKARR